MTYIITFDFPEGRVYAGDYKGAAGFAPSITTAMLFDDPDHARKFLMYAYGPSINEWGRVLPLTTDR